MIFRFDDFKTPGKFVITNFKGANFTSQLNKDYYKIVWACNDELMLEIDGYYISLEKDQLLYCTPLNHIALEEPFDEVVVFLFNREFYCIRDHDHEVSCNGLLFLGSSAPPIVKLDTLEIKEFEVLRMMFEIEFATRDNIQGEMLRVLLKRLLIKSVRLLREQFSISQMYDPNIDIIRQYNLLVESHFRQKHRVSDYAELLNMSPKSISNVFARSNYKNPLRVIKERIALEAQRLLRFSDKNIAEIAEDLGFIEASGFSKFFKKQTGYTPRAYKKMIREKLP